MINAIRRFFARVFGMDRHQQELQELREIRKELKEQGELLWAEGKSLHHLMREFTQVLQELRLILRIVTPRLTAIELQFQGADMPVGSVQLNVGQKSKATVIGFDQTGAAWTGPIPQPSYSIDNPSLDSIADDGSGGSDVTSLAEGTATLTASLSTVEGLALTATGSITNVAVVVPPVLTTLQLNFSDPS